MKNNLAQKDLSGLSGTMPKILLLHISEKDMNTKDDLIIIGNFTPVPREKYRVGVPS